MVYLVTWDLNDEKPNYEQARLRLVRRLDQYESIKDPKLDSVRFVSTNWTAGQIYNDLKLHIDSTDRIIVVKIDNDAPDGHQGQLGSEVWQWINSRIR